MTRDALFQSPPLTRPPPRERRRAGEVAGGAAAECAAVCCCCPCSVMNLLILTVYKVPKGICRKALAHRKKNKRGCLATQKKALLQPRPNGLAGGGLYSDDDAFFRRASSHSDGDVDDGKGIEDESEGDDLLEKEMWDRFYGAGFWRSASRRDL